MPYVEFNDEGLIKGVYARPQPGYADDWLPADEAKPLLVEGLGYMSVEDLAVGDPQIAP